MQYCLENVSEAVNAQIRIAKIIAEQYPCHRPKTPHRGSFRSVSPCQSAAKNLQIYNCSSHQYTILHL